VVPVGGGRVLGSVLDGGPAERAGLSPGDEIVALDRFQVGGEADLRQKLAGRAAGQEVELAVFRRARLETVVLELALAPPNRYEVVALAAAGPLERKLYRDWMGVEHPASGAAIASANVSGTL
jgi:predicted metalloprotease with PDZ domain